MTKEYVSDMTCEYFIIINLLIINKIHHDLYKGLEYSGHFSGLHFRLSALFLIHRLRSFTEILDHLTKLVRLLRQQQRLNASLEILSRKTLRPEKTLELESGNQQVSIVCKKIVLHSEKLAGKILLKIHILCKKIVLKNGWKIVQNKKRYQ